MHVALGRTVVAIGDALQQQPMISFPLKSSNLKRCFFFLCFLWCLIHARRVAYADKQRWSEFVASQYTEESIHCVVVGPYLAWPECAAIAKQGTCNYIARTLIHSVAGSRRFVCFDSLPRFHAMATKWQQRKKKTQYDKLRRFDARYWFITAPKFLIRREKDWTHCGNEM